MNSSLLAELRFPENVAETTTCLICNIGIGPVETGSESFTVHCYRCGTFEINGSAVRMTAHLQPSQRVLLSGFSRDALRAGSSATINSSTIRDSANWPIPKLAERAKRMLLWAVIERDNKPDSRDSFYPGSDTLLGGSYSANAHEAPRLARILADWGYADYPRQINTESVFTTFAGAWAITARGRLFAEAEETALQTASAGFAAMWFDPSMASIFETGIAAGISDAGYDPVRVDQVEHLGKIDDEIMLQIQKSRFVVADFTGHRSGVYFEAGYALGLGLPVIWACRKDQLSMLHFDIRQYNCIDWIDGEDLRRRLAFRIEHTVGPGPRKIAISPQR